jgi:hypothetical protein
MTSERVLSRSARAFRAFRAFRAITVAVLPFAVACSSAGSATPDAGAGALLGGVGAPCESSGACETGLYCNEGAAPLAGLCTMNCVVPEGAADPCSAKYPNTACLVAGVCGLQCGDGLVCPEGTTCQTGSAICVAPADGGGGSEPDAGPPPSASLLATGTDTTNTTTTIDFTGAATSEAVPGVYCHMIASGSLEVEATQGDSNVLLKLWDFDLTAGESRSESFSSDSNTAQISALLISSSAAFRYMMPIDPSGGTCETTITELDTTLAGTFDCSALPGGGGALTLTFNCPME